MPRCRNPECNIRLQNDRTVEYTLQDLQFCSYECGHKYLEQARIFEEAASPFANRKYTRPRLEA